MIMAPRNALHIAPSDAAVAVAATPFHAAAICRLISFWADQGLTIRRELRSVVTSIDDFVAAIYQQRVVGCGALEPVTDQLGEIRSIAVDSGAGKIKAGRAVMDALLEKAQRRGTAELVLLTKTPAFFERFGFAIVDATELPQAYIDMIASQPGRTLQGKVAMHRNLADHTRTAEALDSAAV